MKKAKSRTDGMRPEYNLSDFKKLERGKYYERVRESSNVVVLDPDVAAVFPNSDAVNKALVPQVRPSLGLTWALLTTSGTRGSDPIPSSQVSGQSQPRTWGTIYNRVGVVKRHV